MRTPLADASLATALALGGTRVATTAHPLCACVVDITPTTYDLGGQRITEASRKACPMHGDTT